MSDDSLWDRERVDRYIRMYGDPRERKGTQSQLCQDAALFIIPPDVRSILDVGCGIGHLIPFIGKDVSYEGIDNSEAMISKLSEFFVTDEKEPWRNISIFEADARAFDLGRQFSAVISTSLLLHLGREDAKKVMATMWKHTAPGGVMGFSMESLDLPEQRRPDGLLIRNQPPAEVASDLQSVIGRDIPVVWAHQRAVYSTISDVTLSMSNPYRIQSVDMMARTTLFKVEKS